MNALATLELAVGFGALVVIGTLLVLHRRHQRELETGHVPRTRDGWWLLPLAGLLVLVASLAASVVLLASLLETTRELREARRVEVVNQAAILVQQERTLELARQINERLKAMAGETE